MKWAVRQAAVCVDDGSRASSTPTPATFVGSAFTPMASGVRRLRQQKSRRHFRCSHVPVLARSHPLRCLQRRSVLGVRRRSRRNAGRFHVRTPARAQLRRASRDLPVFRRDRGVPEQSEWVRRGDGCLSRLPGREDRRRRSCGQRCTRPLSLSVTGRDLRYNRQTPVTPSTAGDRLRSRSALARVKEGSPCSPIARKPRRRHGAVHNRKRGRSEEVVLRHVLAENRDFE